MVLPDSDGLSFVSSFFFFSSRRRHTRSKRDWSSDVCSSDLLLPIHPARSWCRGRGPVVPGWPSPLAGVQSRVEMGDEEDVVLSVVVEDQRGAAQGEGFTAGGTYGDGDGRATGRGDLGLPETVGGLTDPDHTGPADQFVLGVLTVL